MQTGKRILVVDDEAPVREALARVLSAAKYAVVPAADGQQARRHVRENEIDLALLDVNLQDENGWDLAGQLRVAQPALPIVMVTACPNQACHPRASLVEAVLEKPVDLPLLFETMERALIKSARLSPSHLEAESPVVTGK